MKSRRIFLLAQRFALPFPAGMCYDKEKENADPTLNEGADV